MGKTEIIPVERIETYIFLIRGQKVMLDFHLAELYNIPTKVLVQAVKRNLGRFPQDFCFQLTESEDKRLRSQIVTSKSGRGGRRYLPYVFTEEGVAMLSSVLHSERAIQMNVAIMRAFVKLRGVISAHKELAQKLFELEQRIEKHDEHIRAIFEAIRQLMQPPEKPKRQIGFRVGEGRIPYHTNRKKHIEH